MSWLADFRCTVVAVGDYNWNDGYARWLQPSWTPQLWPATTLRGTSPSAVIANTTVSMGKVVHLPGIHYHGLAYASFEWNQIRGQVQRLKQAACYGASPDVNDKDEETMDQWERVRQHVDAAEPLNPQGSLLLDWRLWHRRSEEALCEAGRRNLLICNRMGEVGKGQPLETKPTAPGPSHLRPEPIVLGRLRRLHRKVSERQRGAWAWCRRQHIYIG